jgi:hypothetical protein
MTFYPDDLVTTLAAHTGARRVESPVRRQVDHREHYPPNFGAGILTMPPPELYLELVRQAGSDDPEIGASDDLKV